MDKEPVAETPYEYFMRPEPRENLSKIRLEFDELLKKKIKVRDVKIGMVRNAKEKKMVKVYLEPYPHIRIEKAKPLQGWYKGKHERNQVRPRPCYTEALLTEPYGGWCPVGCRFCYINSGFRGYRGTGLATVPVNYGEQLRQQLKKVRRGAAAYFTSFSEPFLPLESLYHNTQQGAEACDEVGLPLFFLSRLWYPNWAIELLARNKHSYAQKSINTPSENDWKKLSPGALSLAGHRQDIKRLKKAGIYVSIQVNPVIPGVTTNKQLVELFGMLSRAGADHVIVKFAEAGYSWAPAMVERMVKAFGDRGRRFADLFQENIGGQRTIVQSYRMAAHRMLKQAAENRGMTYSVCYEYEYEKNEEGEIVDKVGVSIGRKVTTADQCHGHRVPVYVRDSEEEKFRPLRSCPPTGCLYCAEDNEGEPRCGDDLAGEAPALRTVDLRRPIG